jgi:hypothetical protein
MPALVAALLLVPAAASAATRCGTPAITALEHEQVQSALARWNDEGREIPAGGVIRVAVHVITANGLGDVSDGHIAAQMSALDRAYAAHGYRFELASVERTEQPAWFRMEPGSTVERAARQALARDPAHTLNLYTCAPPGPVLGWATSPFGLAEGSASHGVVVHHATLADGAESAGLGGRTAVHQVGHYLGLQHQAEGGDLPALATGDDRHVGALLALYRPSLIATAFEAAPADPMALEDEPTRALAFRGGTPNPFRTDTAIRFTMPVSGRVTLRVYDVAGKLVRTLVDAQLPPGDHSALLRGDGLPSGTYFTVLKVGKLQTSRSLTLVR